AVRRAQPNGRSHGTWVCQQDAPLALRRGDRRQHLRSMPLPEAAGIRTGSGNAHGLCRLPGTRNNAGAKRPLPQPDCRQGGIAIFSQAPFNFLDELAANNERSWFTANRERYEALVRAPALNFIAAMAPELRVFARRFRADPRPTGGSLMRVHRDTRFSRDKRPYKTNVGVQLRHELGTDVHSAGFHMHLASDGCFLGAGYWHPDPVALAGIRVRIANHPQRWFAVRDDPQFRAHWVLAGDSLSRPPRGHAADHPAIEDVRRKDFIGLAPLSFAEATAEDLVSLATQRFAAAMPLLDFLCQPDANSGSSNPRA
ncbi:MAG TPA: TIGR02453 family protein, partial [Candidatus Accumulibacter phosphatis]|nr:TIGR02453 family protein [Candidatus Accumulibacter phosphatis]